MALLYLIKRNCKLFFKDKGIFFTSLITPIILLVLYTTFLSNIYKDSILSMTSQFTSISDDIVNAVVSGQLFSSLLAVSTITISFCSNMIMVQDKVTGARKDITLSPVKRSTLAFSYYISTTISTLIICIVATLACFLYIYNIGWYLSLTDVIYIFLDVLLLVLFGTALSSIINFFLSSQGQISAVSSIISAGYGFICGAYMPISQFGETLQKALSFLPSTYATSLIKNHALNGAFIKMEDSGIPSEIVENIKKSIDCNLYFFYNKVEINTMYLILCLSIFLLMLIYIILNIFCNKKVKR